ncbi:MAG: efflux RND transporter periplasmic adaptor subunit [Rhizobiaceae bacterium]|nr:efflux RND transporter periplasmic adaptor subunit [Rhizobiaceae bacterium]
MIKYRRCAAAIALLFAATAMASCSNDNTYVPPPPPKVSVALPIKQTITRHLEATGNTSAVNTATLLARVPGFIQEIDYQDGDMLKAGQRAFLIEPQPYQLALDQAKAGLASAQAASKASAAELKRQQELLSQKVTAQSSVDQAAAQADADAAKVQQAEVDVKQAELNLSYTEVKAPFDGIVTARQVSQGQYVGSGSPTALASIVQLDPIYASFTVGEQDVLRIREAMAKRGITDSDLRKVEVEIGLQTDEGFPHKGTLDYVAPEVTSTTGTLPVRAVFENKDGLLLPGYFVRVRVPLGQQPDMLLIPDRAIGANQSGRYVLVANKDDVVEERRVDIGQLVGELRVITDGITAQDRVITDGLMKAAPGQKVQPEITELEPVVTDGTTP